MHIIQDDEFNSRSEESIIGLRANTVNKLKGAFLGALFGGKRVSADRGDNLWMYDGKKARFHIAVGKKSITFHPSTEPESVIVPYALNSKPNLYAIYGLKLADCLRVAKSRNGSTRLSITNFMAVRKRVDLGRVTIPPDFVEAIEVADRDELLDRIDDVMAKLHRQESPKHAWPEIVSYKTHENFWEFVTGVPPVATAKQEASA